MADAATASAPIIELDHVGYRQQSADILVDVSWKLERGQRWAILGPNGSGKTTLLRCLLSQEQPDKGRAVLGQGVAVGYFDQHLSALDDEMDVVDAIRPAHKEFDTPKRRSLLARFGVTGDTALQKVKSLSGGERCRAALARLAARDVKQAPAIEPEATPGRAAALLSHRLFGTVA